MSEAAEETVQLTEEDVIRALVIDALENGDAFNSESVQKALEAVDMVDMWRDASPSNEFPTEDLLWVRVLNAVCVAAKVDGFGATEFFEVLVEEDVEHVIEEMEEDEEEDGPGDEDGDDEDNDDDDEDDEEDEEEDEE